MSRAFIVLSWIASALLAIVAIVLTFAFYVARTIEPEWAMFLAPACLTAAALLLFPPIWKAQSSGRSPRIRLVAAAVLTAIALVAPVTVVVDMPIASQH